MFSKPVLLHITEKIVFLHFTKNKFQLLQRLSRLEKFKHKLLIPEFSNGVVETANSEVVNDENVNLENTNDDESARKRKRGRPATKDKSVGTGPSQPSVNKAVQV